MNKNALELLFGETSFVTNIGELVVFDQPTENSVKVIWEDKSTICRSFLEFDEWIWSLDANGNPSTQFPS